MAHDGTHAHAAHGGAVHHDVSDDKRAAFAGLLVGMVLIGGFLFGMVKWTNYHLGAREAGTAAESTK